MPKLKGFIAKLEEVEEQYQALYVQDGDRFRLDADGVEDVTGLKSALEKEKRDAAVWRKKADAYGMSPDDVAKLQAEKDAREREAAEKAGNWQALQAQMAEKHAKDIADKEAALGKKDRALRRRVVDAEVTRAIAAAEGVTELLLPHVSRFVDVRETDDDYEAYVHDGKGGARVGDAAGHPMTIGQLVGEMKGNPIYAPAFKASGSSGSGAAGSNGGAGGSGRTVSRDDPVAMGRHAEDIAKGLITVV